MRVPHTGLTLPLDEAKTQLTDNKGNLLQFEQQKDGTYHSNDVEGDGYTYSFDLVPQTTLVTVYANKVKKGDKKSANLSKEEAKAIEDAKIVAENAPDSKTKKEAEKVASLGNKTKLG